MRDPEPVVLPAAAVMPLVTEALGRGQRVRLTATGSSMLPLLRPGDTVELAPLDGPPVLGAVVLVVLADRAWLHRVARLSGDTVWTQGDATRRHDPPVPLGAIHGQVVAVWRKGRALGDQTGRWRLAGRLWQLCQPVSGWLLGVARHLRSHHPAHLVPRTVFDALLAGLRLDAPTLGEVSAAQWGAVVSMAQRHGVAPMLYDRLRAVGLLERLPAEVAEQLRRVYLSNLARSTQMLAELGRVLGALDRGGVRAIPLKGAYLAQAVYGNPALRALGDLDLLVPRRSLGRAAVVLDGLGYDVRAWRGPLPDKRHEMLPISCRATRTSLDVHWCPIHVGEGAGRLVRELWASSRPAQVAGQAARALADEELLLALMWHWVHADRLCGDLRNLVDIATLVERRPALDWARVMELAQTRGWVRGLAVALQAAAGWLGAPVPAAVLAAVPVEPARLARLADLFEAGLPRSVAAVARDPRGWLRQRARWARLVEAVRTGGGRTRPPALAALAAVADRWQRYGPLLRRWLSGDPLLRRGWAAQRERDDWLSGA